MKKSRTFDAVTGLKGICIILIVFYHTLPQTTLIDKIPFTSFIRIYGRNLGNYMFFMISGFLIAYGYRDRIAAGDVSFGAFLMRRLQKLYPLYIISNLVMLIGDVMEYGPSAIKLDKIVFTIFLQSGGGLESMPPYNGATWFLSALFVCYIAYFFVAYYGKTRTSYRCFICFGILWGYSRLFGGWDSPICFGRNGESFLNFFLGCALAETLPYLTQKVWKWLQPAAVLILVGAGFLLMCYGVEIISGDSRVAFAFLVCPLVICLAVGDNLISRFLKLKPVLYLGKLSVSIYFWHVAIYDLFMYIYRTVTCRTEMDSIQYAVYIVIMLILSALSQRFLEGDKGIFAGKHLAST